MAVRRARRNGILAAFNAPAGARAADLRLYTGSGANRKLVLRRLVSARPGLNRVRLRSRKLKAALYTLEVRVGTSRSQLGSASVTRLRLTRR
jgi:hypothetical protein